MDTSAEAFMPKGQTPLQSLVCGSTAGFMGKLVEYPFDTVKVLLQTQPQYRGPVHCATHLVKTSGLFSLYRGLASPLAGSILENAILFAGYDYLKKAVGTVCGVGQSPEQAPMGLSHLATSGALAGCLAAFVLTPVELVKCRLQAQSGTLEAGGSLSLAIRIWKTSGIRGLYIGHSATLLREAGGGAAWFGVYEAMCKAMLPPGCQEKDTLGPGRLMIAGAAAGMAYNAVLFPVDTIKSHVQIMAPDANKGSGGGMNRILRVARRIWGQEGIRGFYRGMGITMVRSVPGSSVIFLTYEMMQRQWPN
ncbi:mitochondrial carrier domain-containing protein [Piptocephalis cylindrospora]|uniref:Mitochondrial carrier domain-containing protein n=1 Tax=Piptocephalis cylindrospora TaxID=1907219 RepID=A0A4P9Y642_9FUNG|nr:mitochondrial carrier domain-containing protein [Piptocephalis cylindrospora]|eukprot:RKP14204.1 mitochondrial carrier domain-containing protein [Piptocephalis cylindrospora]